MSFEGYNQILCARGHAFQQDVYSDEVQKCWLKWCGAPIAWTNTVDETNGESAGYVNLELDKPAETHTCVCGDEHVMPGSRATYKIPEKGIGRHRS